ncbi:hypothetical protein GBAR_LOCUS18500, partial [Geodia barretti]
LLAHECLPPAAKKPRAGGPRFTIQLTFGNTDTMAAFKERMEALKSALAPAGALTSIEAES